jgi:hypothetical protein
LAAATPPDPPLTAAQPTADRGTARTGPPITHTFELTNATADGRILITGVRSGCGCLKPTVSRDSLRPGERASVTVSVNTLTQPAGPHSWRTTVSYRLAPLDGPAPPPVTADQEVTLTVSATLVREVTATPPEVAFSTAGTATQTVVITDPRPTPLTVTAAATTSPHLTATLGPRTQVGTQPVTLNLTAGYPVGTGQETVVLTTTDPGCPELRIPVTVTKRPTAAIVAAPAEPQVRFAAEQTEASVLVQLRKPGGGSLRVEKADADHPAVRVRWSADAGPVATIRLTVDAAKASAAGNATVRVLFAEPTGVTLDLPLRWSGLVESRRDEP